MVIFLSDTALLAEDSLVRASPNSQEA
jgi:hypothetical protein